LLTRQLDSYRLSSEKSEKAFSEQQSRYINEKFLWARSNSELQHSLDAAHSTVQSLQSKLASANDESKHEIARLISRNKELEDTFEALNQSIGTLRQKLSTSEHRIETLQQSVANQSSALSTLENTLSSNELSYKRDIDRYLSKISELQCMVDKSQQNELEAKRRVSDMELQRCNDEMHMSISNQDLTSKLAALAKDIERHKEESTLLKTEVRVFIFVLNNRLCISYLKYFHRVAHRLTSAVQRQHRIASQYCRPTRRQQEGARARSSRCNAEAWDEHQAV
jgi:phage shock protein A